MPTDLSNPINQFVKERLDQAQHRLQSFEKDASKVLREVRTRGRARQAQVADLIAKVQPTELIEDAWDAERELRKAAGRFGDQLGKRVTDLQESMLHFAGIASREEVESISDDLAKISRKLDRLVKAQPKPTSNGGARSRKGKTTLGDA